MSREYYLTKDEAMDSFGEHEQFLIVKRMFGEYITDEQLHNARKKDADGVPFTDKF
jgi:hypothetical protein